jgi:hypothetical protein
MNEKISYLNIIQAVISRMASNSFLVKGWTVTLFSALLALTVSSSSKRYLPIGFIPLFAFWYLDYYYLRQERLFRKLYEHVIKPESPANFSMDTAPFSNVTGCIFLSPALAGFYIPLLVINLISFPLTSKLLCL